MRNVPSTKRMNLHAAEDAGVCIFASMQTTEIIVKKVKK